MPSVNQIRTTFLQFFEKASHTIVPSSPLVPHNDPTLMFTNAGMVQFKNVFTGAEKLKFTKATSSQKCVRAGGKHNDLDNVGYTARHHTFFEMLGNFSFGDYFKETAIELGWKFLTQEVGLPKEKLYVTVYHTDDEAYGLWQKIAGLSSDRIIRIATQDNFWAMGDTGPCGPCSEIFYDHGPHIAGGLPGTPEEDGDRYIEIWNLVFMQYEQLASGERIALPKPSIDTGMGLERISAVLQGVHDNYDIDLFKFLISASEELSGVKVAGEHAVSHRVIADHLRSSSFLIADGVLPSNEGRGYVLRRIMRRAMRHAHQLGCKEPLMHRLVPALVKEMGAAYPELVRAEAVIKETLRLEEERFKETLGRGLKLLETESAPLQAGQKLSGEVAFKLYDTYGFPLDLTKDILRQRDIEVDDQGFETSMQKQREMARASWVGSGEKATQEIWFDIREEAGATEFLGYELNEAQGKVVALVQEGKRITKLDQLGATALVVVNQTPFYGESGGQMGDCGTITTENGTVLEVTDTKKYVGDLIVHQVVLKQGNLEPGAIVTLTINEIRRDKLRANHSATHLLHHVLREQLGNHVTQKGSLVAEDRLRFDFSHPKGLSVEEVTVIEQAVNRMIRTNNAVGTALMTPDKAIESGAMALFGEKYGEEVRVVSMGNSIELCGGTHVRSTGDIGLFKIISEAAIAAGVRRIEAMTGEAALQFVRNEEAVLAEAAGLLKVSPADIAPRIAALLEERKRLEKELTEVKKKALTGGAGAAEKEQINGVAFMGKVLEEVPAKDLRGIVDSFKAQLGSGIVAIVSVSEGKASMVVGVTDDLKHTYDAVTLVKTGAAILGGSGGGGKPELAQAGGPDASKAKEAVDAVRRHLAA